MDYLKDLFYWIAMAACFHFALSDIKDYLEKPKE